MLSDSLVAVSTEVTLFVARSDGPPDRTLLVIHGGPDWDHSYLREPLAALGDRYQLLLPDLRGCGRSTRGLADDQYNPDAAVGDLVALLDAVGVADVLGFSYGGLIAQRLALTAPHRVRRLILASTSVLPVPPDAFDGWTERTELRAAEERMWADTALSGAELTREAAMVSAPANVWRASALPGYLARLREVRFTAEWMRPWQAGTLPSARCDDAAARLAELDIPVLLLHGRQDMTFPVTLVPATTALLPSARAVILEEAGHMAHVDQPERWLAAVSDFLAEPAGRR
jgi:pimeloyl-ACP methyl ester carboxylesterase